MSDTNDKFKLPQGPEAHFRSHTHTHTHTQSSICCFHISIPYSIPTVYSYVKNTQLRPCHNSALCAPFSFRAACLSLYHCLWLVWKASRIFHRTAALPGQFCAAADITHLRRDRTDEAATRLPRNAARSFCRRREVPAVYVRC